MGPARLKASETRREYIHVDSSPTSLLVKVSEAFNHPGPGCIVQSPEVQREAPDLKSIELCISNY